MEPWIQWQTCAFALCVSQNCACFDQTAWQPECCVKIAQPQLSVCTCVVVCQQVRSRRPGEILQQSCSLECCHEFVVKFQSAHCLICGSKRSLLASCKQRGPVNHVTGISWTPVFLVWPTSKQKQVLFSNFSRLLQTLNVETLLFCRHSSFEENTGYVILLHVLNSSGTYQWTQYTRGASWHQSSMTRVQRAKLQCCHGHSIKGRCHLAQLAMLVMWQHVDRCLLL